LVREPADVIGFKFDETVLSRVRLDPDGRSLSFFALLCHALLRLKDRGEPFARKESAESDIACEPEEIVCKGVLLAPDLEEAFDRDGEDSATLRLPCTVLEDTVLLGKRCKSSDKEASAVLASVGEPLRDPGPPDRIFNLSCRSTVIL
jgi:hypothetical protein